MRYFNCAPLIVGPGIKTGMPILYENPKEVGADRIVNAVAAYDRYASACIVVDFGTATTFDYVTGRGEYAGGAIAPGLANLDGRADQACRQALPGRIGAPARDRRPHHHRRDPVGADFRLYRAGRWTGGRIEQERGETHT